MQAIKLSSYQAIVLLVAIWAAGCSAEGTEGLQYVNFLGDSQEEITSSTDIDCGVLFVGEGSYFCFPLSRFGISSADRMDHIESSCRCVRSSLVQYVGPQANQSMG